MGNPCPARHPRQPRPQMRLPTPARLPATCQRPAVPPPLFLNLLNSDVDTRKPVR